MLKSQENIMLWTKKILNYQNENKNKQDWLHFLVREYNLIMDKLTNKIFLRNNTGIIIRGMS